MIEVSRTNGEIVIMADVESRTLQPGPIRATGFLLSNIVFGVIGFGLVMTTIPFGLLTLVFWVGILVLCTGLLLLRGAAQVHRTWLHTWLGVYIARPYRVMPTGAAARLRTLLTDGATWKDTIYLLLMFPIGMAELIGVSMLWGIGLGMSTMPLYYGLFDKGDEPQIFHPDFVVDTFGEAMICSAVGLLILCMAIIVVPAVAKAHAKFAVWMLGPSRKIMNGDRESTPRAAALV
ncbi:putative sensor protein [Herbihabitans rhizosphaerae]|uniref:Putative sensor protein n=1 Tax=Herbihabitans rhizosphaerae TaxID=1872711 RepID=A0A4V2ERJ9_9PSEU|nr:sensor domain-containing protein [Herbihabitans rhizosphaerae]RZS32209.1 putative sensor protein [Herbihabitans rhizosphaerae]